MKISDYILERTARRLMVKVSPSLVDVTNVKSSGTLEISAEVLTMQTRCQSIACALIASLKK